MTQQHTTYGVFGDSMNMQMQRAECVDMTNFDSVTVSSQIKRGFLSYHVNDVMRYGMAVMAFVGIVFV
ncbi:hypothetical protein [Desulfovibrio inopinatus]|uniref:hypothetical protein n=1 Tax=Desulfovibrio inopinatus TaxID=102109 RepID=UPI0003F583D7|nr:hypothetical protein [Desulfovibrio inopinatus]